MDKNCNDMSTEALLDSKTDPDAKHDNVAVKNSSNETSLISDTHDD